MKRLHDLQDVNSDIERLWPKSDVRRAERAADASSVSKVGPETVRLRADVDELEDALKKANRRIERLIGEKSQLKSFLNRRDREIQQLSRELGGHPSSRKAIGLSGGVLSSVLDSPATFVASIRDRIRDFFVDEPVVTTVHANDRETRESAGSACEPLIARQQNGSAQQIIAAMMFGLDRDEIERLLPLVERDCASKGLTPLFLIDIDAFELLRGRDLIFEYLPPEDDRDRFDSSLHWDLYLQRRLALIRRKWNPFRIVAFGASATKTLTLWYTSPFEDTPLPAVSVDSPAA